MRWCSVMFLLTACADQAVPLPVADAPTLKPEPVLTAHVADADPVTAVAPGGRCPTLGAWERPTSPCIVEADKTESRWGVRIATPRLRFELNSSKMDPASLKVVDSVAALLHKHPEFEQVEIHAHTDSKASHHY
ncbi:MAG: hypothetical protein KUG77_00765 [Nannocystaceae bacterium]|nr:hypothetical protein [Nannocystaceae bacterium]